MKLHISVRNLVEFLLRAGDIDNRRVGKLSENAMQEGGRIHRKLQKAAGSGYAAEVSLSYEYMTEDYSIIVEGRADGVFQREREQLLEDRFGQGNLFLLADDTDVIDEYIYVIDEIKGTYRDVSLLKEPEQVHLAQAMCYAFFYAHSYQLGQMGVRMTYCNMDSEEIRYFTYCYSYPMLLQWFSDLMGQYIKWADFQYEWEQIRTHSVQELQFPFSYRDGQKELMTHVYSTICHKKKLFIQAPTGVGKTISTLFPAIKAVGEGKAEKIFYLTAKTITRTVAIDTFDLLRESGLRMKTVLLTAKEKICPLDKAVCNPDACPYAKGHYDRINEAVYDLLTGEDSFTREKISEYALKHEVCPFEFSLDMSLFADGIVCDYNYLFDPHVYLKRFFETSSPGRYFFLVDEAHNLLERGREMYSAHLVKEEIMTVRKEIKNYASLGKGTEITPYHANAIVKALERVNRHFLALKRECDTEYEEYEQVEEVNDFIMAVGNAHGKISKYLEECTQPGELREIILDLYFKLSHFMLILETIDDKYRVYTTFDEQGSFFCKLFCVSPENHLRRCMERGVSSILFSATFLPIQYYKTLLGGNKDDYEVYAHSTFDPSRRGLFIARDVTSKYTKRNEDMYQRIASHIQEIIEQQAGNYIVFFPSHAFAGRVFRICSERFSQMDAEWLLQSEYMNEEQREAFLARFYETGIHQETDGATLPMRKRTLVAFCVMGGIFSEGIDLKGDALIGAIIVGNGLPQVCTERKILKDYFDEEGKGFDYAYKYPGVNKVFQAAGRVIRTAEDVGIVVLLEDRFLEMEYQKLFPKEWQYYTVVNEVNVGEAVAEFWEEFK